MVGADLRAHTPPPQCSRLVPVPGTCSVLLFPLLDAKTSLPSRNTLEQGLPGLLGPIPPRGATSNPQGSAPGPLSCLHLGPQSLEQDPRPRSCGARGQSSLQCPLSLLPSGQTRASQARKPGASPTAHGQAHTGLFDLPSGWGCILREVCPGDCAWRSPASSWPERPVSVASRVQDPPHCLSGEDDAGHPEGGAYWPEVGPDALGHAYGRSLCGELGSLGKWRGPFHLAASREPNHQIIPLASRSHQAHAGAKLASGGSLTPTALDPGSGLLLCSQVGLGALKSTQPPSMGWVQDSGYRLSQSQLILDGCARVGLLQGTGHQPLPGRVVWPRSSLCTCGP